MTNNSIKFHGLECQFDENNEPVPNQIGLVTAVYSFKATVPKGKRDRKSRTYYVPTDIEITMRTDIDPETPAKDWNISAQSFADLWVNASKRHERHLFEAQMAKVGVLFYMDGDKWSKAPTTLMEMHKPKDYIANEL